jgi:aldehyde:ferredoxin oxidoreductase
MAGGMHGRILTIDLETRAIGERSIDEADAHKFYLGSGLAAKILMEWDGIEAMKPLDPGMPLIFMSGFFLGTALPATPKLSVCAKQAATGIWNESTVGGHWPAEFRLTGWDGMILTGKASSPVTLVITEDSVEIRDAERLWGLDTEKTDHALRAEHGEGWRFGMIGPAGEKLAAIAGIIFDPPNNRIAARGGIGAVMGSKNLKAIAVRGKKRPPIARKDLMTQLLKEQGPTIKENTQGLYNFGTSGGVEAVEMFGDLPIKNWQLGSWKENAKKISGQTMQPEYLDHHYACYACPIRCGKIYKIPDHNVIGHGPEYESIAMLGSNCLNDDPHYLVQACHICDLYGMDTMSAGHAVSFTMEAFERGILSEKETGFKVEWGGPSVLKLLHLIGKREGIGDLLANGIRHAARTIGKGAEEMAVEVKGLEIAGHDPRGHVGMSLNYATANRGGCHLEGLTYFLDRGIPAPDFGFTTPPDPHNSEDKPPIVVTMQNYLSVFNCLALCKFLFVGRVGPKILAQWYEAVTGRESSMEEIMTTGERIYNLKRCFNVRMGISRKDDVLPPRMYSGAKPDGRAAGVVANLGKMLHEYYKLRGWNEFGIPLRSKLEELGIADLHRGAEM